MITQQSPSPEMPYYDPLQTQFMTGGTMQYMPGAQHMTSANYGAYRTMPGANMQLVGQKAPTFLQAYAQANRGSILGSPEYMVDSYNPGVNQQRHQVMAQRQMQDKMSGFAGGVADFGLSMGAGALGVMAGGPLVGLAASMAAPQMSGSYTDRVRQQRKIQDMSMSKIVGGPDMAASIGQGFSMSASAGLDSSIRRQSVDDFTFNQEDYQKITRLGIESGMMDYDNSADQYKQTIKKLRDNFVGMMNILDSDDLKDLSKTMQRMQRMGQEQGNMTSMAGQEAMFSRMVGVSHKDMVNSYGQAGAMAYSQAGMTGYQGSLENMSQAASITMMQRTGTLSAGEVSRMGGVSGGAQRATAGKANMVNSTKGSWLPALMNEDGSGLDKEKIQAFIAGDKSIDELAIESAASLNNTSKALNYKENESQYLQDFQDEAGPMGTGIAMMQMAKKMGQQVNPDGDLQNQLYSGYSAFDMDDETARLNAKKFSNPEVLRGMQDQYRMQQHEIKQGRLQEQKHNSRPWNRIGHAFREMTTSLTEDTFGTFAAERAAEKDMEENRKAGIYTTADRGMQSAFTIGADFKLSEEEKKQADAYAGGGSPERVHSKDEVLGVLDRVTPHTKRRDVDYRKEGKDREDELKALDARIKQADKPRERVMEATYEKHQEDFDWKEHAKLVKEKQKRSDQQIRRQFIEGPELSEEERAASRKEFGFGSGMEAGKFLQEELDSGDINQKGLVRAVMKQKDISKEEAGKFLSKNDGQNKRFMLKKLSEQSGGEELQQEVQQKFVDVKEDILKERYEKLDSLKEEADDSLTSLVDSSLFGRDKSGVDAIKTAIGETGSSKKGMGIYAAKVLQQKAEKKRFGGLYTEESKTALNKQLKDLGMPEDMIKEVVENGRSDLIDKFAGEEGMSEDTLSEMDKAAEKKQTEMNYKGSSDQLLKDVKGAASKARVAATGSAVKKVETTLSGSLKGGKSFREYIEDPNLITEEFLESVDDKNAKGMFKRIREMQEERKDGSLSPQGDPLKPMDTVDTIVALTKEGAVGNRQAKESSVTGTQFVGMDGSAAAKSGSTADVIGTVLREVNTTLIKLNATLQDKEEGGLFSWFGGKGND